MKTVFATVAVVAAAGLTSAQAYSGDTTNPDGFWDRPIGAGPIISGLGPVAYDLQIFNVTADGLYSFDSQQDYDGYLTIYADAFEPTDQLTNLLAGNDDGAGGIGTSNIDDLALFAGVNYFIVTSGFSAGDAGSFTNTVSGAGTAIFAPVPAPATAALLGLGGLVATRRRR